VRGKVLGGSSSVNFMIYTRGSKDDFDRFARVTGDQGWGWNQILPFILKVGTWRIFIFLAELTLEFRQRGSLNPKMDIVPLENLILVSMDSTGC
jgi:choline dehydrogenase-like flavoprotein